jgi:hypothetical protein
MIRFGWPYEVFRWVTRAGSSGLVLTADYLCKVVAKDRQCGTPRSCHVHHQVGKSVILCDPACASTASQGFPNPESMERCTFMWLIASSHQSTNMGGGSWGMTSAQHLCITVGEEEEAYRL